MNYLEKGKVYCSRCKDFIETILDLKNFVKEENLFSIEVFEDVGDGFVESIYDEEDLMKILEDSLKIRIK